MYKIKQIYCTESNFFENCEIIICYFIVKFLKFNVIFSMQGLTVDAAVSYIFFNLIILLPNTG